MATMHLHRLSCLIPAARRVAMNTWIKAAIDAGGSDWFTVGLSPTGQPPATHYVCNAALIPAQLKLWMVQLCIYAGIGEPAGWDTMSRTQRKQWFQDQRNTIRTATGIRYSLADNDAEWDDPMALLAAAGLQPMQPEQP